MSLFNSNGGTLISAAGPLPYCTIETIMPTSQATSTVGGDCSLIQGIGWLIVGNATATGTVNLQKKGPDGTYRTIAASPFPLTITNNIISSGGILAEIGHGYQFSIAITAGGLIVCELMGLSEIGE